MKLEAASLNPFDWKVQKGMLRPFLPHKFPHIPGKSVCFCYNPPTPQRSYLVHKIPIFYGFGCNTDIFRQSFTWEMYVRVFRSLCISESYTSLHFRILYNSVLKLLVYACRTNEIENREKVGKGGIIKFMPTN